MKLLPSNLYLATYLGCSCLLLSQTVAELLETPRLRWSFTLDGGDQGRSLRQGNAVVPWRGGDKLFATADDGSLHIIDLTSDGASTAAVFEPSTVGRAVTESRSGVTVVDYPSGTGDKNIEYLVYAVVDAADDTSSTSSRVIAVNMDGTLRWTVIVDGRIVGTPQVGADGRGIYVSRNVGNQGFLSVIRASEDGTTAELTASLSPDDRDAPLGPPAIREVIDGNDGQDFVSVAESWDGGTAEEGSIYVLAPSDEFEDLEGKGNASYELRLIARASWEFSTTMAPLFQGDSLWIGGARSILSGYTENRDVGDVLNGRREDVDPRWQAQLPPLEEDPFQSLSVTPVLSADSGLLFQPAVIPVLYCLEAARGRQFWAEALGSRILNSPILSEIDGDSVVYFIESEDGRVRQLDIDSGDENWRFSCEDASGVVDCQDSVEAEFSVSPSGNLLYYGDVFGKIVALEVGEFATQAPTGTPSVSPTLSPSDTPSLSQSPSALVTSEPTAAPSVKVTLPPVPPPTITTAPVAVENDENQFQVDDGSTQTDSGDELSTGLIIGVAMGGLVLLAILAVLIANTFFKKKPKKKQGRSKEVRSAMAMPRDIENGSSSDESYEMDDVQVTAESGDSMQVEVTAGAHLYNTPSSKRRKSKKRRKNKAARTPSTTGTLDSITESVEEAEGDEALDDTAKKDLFEQFQAMGDNDDSSVDSDGSIPPPPPPPLPVEPPVEKGLEPSTQNEEEEVVFTKSRTQEEEKKEDMEQEPMTRSPPPRAVSPRPEGIQTQPSFGKSSQPSFGMSMGNEEEPLSPSRSVTSAQSLLSAVAAAFSPSPSTNTQELSPRSPAQSTTSNRSHVVSSPKMLPEAATEAGSPERSTATPLSTQSPGNMSTDSSLYIDDKSGLGGSQDADDIKGPDHSMLQPTLSHEERDFYTEEAPDDERIRAPGAHYFSAAPVRPRFTPSTAAGSSSAGIKSVRTKKNLNGFAPSNLEADDTKREPSFKRRNKKEEVAAAESNTISDTWSSFLSDLAEAEQQFFSPTNSSGYYGGDETSEFLHDDADTVEM